MLRNKNNANNNKNNDKLKNSRIQTNFRNSIWITNIQNERITAIKYTNVGQPRKLV